MPAYSPIAVLDISHMGDLKIIKRLDPEDFGLYLTINDSVAIKIRPEQLESLLRGFVEQEKQCQSQ